jgi:predicted amidohydrolase YtcJ
MSGLLLRRAHLVDLDGTGTPGPVDVRIVDGAVTEIGPGLAAEGAGEVDADGRWLMPGLWDQHVHLGQWTLASRRLDLVGIEDHDAALRAVVERLATTEGPVVAWGHRPAGWAEQPTVAALDAVAPDRPVVLIAGDGHHAWLNTVALDALGLPRRDIVVEETEWFATYPRLAEALGEDGSSVAAYVEVQRRAAALGVVGITDFEFGAPVHAWPERAGAGGALLRVRVATYAETLDDYLALDRRTGDPLVEGSTLSMGPLKIISDGSLNTRTAWCCSPYADVPTVGAPNLTESELHDLLGTAKRHGLEVATHAIGDAAVAHALDAYAATGAAGSIEHAQLMAREDIPRMAGLGIRASVQPAHLLDDREATERSWPDRMDRCFMLRTMLDAGVTLALGSDAPVSRLDPWLAVAAAVHRSPDEREPWQPEESLTACEALSASVDGQGTVHVDMPADLVLLDADPLASYDDSRAAARVLREMSVAATWIAGELVHDRV